MFMRLVQMRVNPDKIYEFKNAYERVIIPALQHTPGCVYAGLVHSLEEENDGISFTLWSHQDDALAYERSGKYAQLLEVSRPFFSESAEWRVQLSVDLRPEFWPVPPEPVVKSYGTDVSALKASGVPDGRAGSMYLRIMSMKLNPEKKREFVEIYHREIIPGLRQVEGCLDAYLAEGVRWDHELLSITIWSGLEHAKAYEATGEFDRLKQKVQHTFSNIALWKMAPDEEPLPGAQGIAKRAETRDDVAVRTYSIVLGKALK
ncbi:MAG: antibiotic biosynthesis monooxygenase [Bacteroidota bacterium]